MLHGSCSTSWITSSPDRSSAATPAARRRGRSSTRSPGAPTGAPIAPSGHSRRQDRRQRPRQVPELPGGRHRRRRQLPPLHREHRVGHRRSLEGPGLAATEILSAVPVSADGTRHRSRLPLCARVTTLQAVSSPRGTAPSASLPGGRKRRSLVAPEPPRRSLPDAAEQTRAAAPAGCTAICPDPTDSWGSDWLPP